MKGIGPSPIAGRSRWGRSCPPRRQPLGTVPLAFLSSPANALTLTRKRRTGALLLAIDWVGDLMGSDEDATTKASALFSGGPAPALRNPVDASKSGFHWGAAAGIAGPILLVVYFAVPALAGWPYAGASPQQLITYANSHTLLFYAGGWLQATGATLSILFFLTLLNQSGTARRMAGLVTLVGCALLLAVVLIEAALLEAVPVAAHAKDTATVATAFALSNGVFARIFPLAPAPLLFAGIAYALRPAVLHEHYARSAKVVAALFVVAGIAAVFGTPGLIFAIVMSVVQAAWILAAAVALSISARRTQQASGDENHPAPRACESGHT